MTVRGFHHVEIWLTDRTLLHTSWAWLLGELGFEKSQEWAEGASWSAGGAYLTLTTSPNLSGAVHDRRLPGMNHLAFHGGTRAEVDAVMSAAPRHGWTPLYGDRYPYAGGEAHYAGWLEDAHGFKVEVVASS